MTKTLWMIEAQCPRCGETYNPHSLSADDVQHWCNDEQFGGKPAAVWMYYQSNMGLVREKRVLRTKLVNWKSNIAALIVVTLCIWGLVWMFAVALDDRTEGLPACATEDSDNCYWDANVQGNGEGRSFTVVDGEVNYWD